MKSADQQALQGLHQVRSGWMKTRTAMINQLRGLLGEYGILAPQGACNFVQQVVQLLESHGEDVPRLQRLYEQIRELEQQVEVIEQSLKRVAEQREDVQRLRSIPGIGLLGATALVAYIPDWERFKNGRQFSAFLGATPKEHSSGERRHVGGITKVGNTYVRTLLTHGARAVLQSAKREGQAEADRLKAWALEVEQRRGHNKATLAVVNKLARIAYGVMTGQRPYCPMGVGVAA